MKNYSFKSVITAVLMLLFFTKADDLVGQNINVGSGSYTTTFPGVDEANRNAYPSGTPQISGAALNKPVPTNDWWSNLIKNDHANNLFNYPLALGTTNEGLLVSYIVPSSGPNGSSQPMGDARSIVVGVDGLNASKATVSDYSDWTVRMDWSSGSSNFEATAGIAMPFLYFTKETSDVAKVTVNEGNVAISYETLIISNSAQGSDYAIYAPQGSSWTKSGNTYTSSLNGKNYWSMAYLPPSAASVTTVANAYKKHAYVFPDDTRATWDYNQETGKLTTTFNVSTTIKEGSDTEVLLGLLPHQWGNLASNSPQPSGYSYPSIRGEIKTLAGNSFQVENTFKGILPTLPYLTNYSPGFSPAEMATKVAQIENDGLATWTDSYNEGQVMNRLIQTARIADQMGNTEARDKMVATVKERLEDWLTYSSSEVAFLFYYNNDWTTLIGYPAGHGQDSNINDHHFHWGYFIHAASFMEQFEPGWANQWGEMVNHLVRDAASYDRDDPKFPYLRNFSPYAGHSWANGFATFPFGNDQESTSESMQFNSSLIHWGTITGNDTIRDLGIYLYTTEQTATEEYWFDINERTFKPEYGYSLASRIWGNGYDNQTFWTSDIAAAYGIEMYPIHGGSLYLGHNTTYVQKLWNEIKNNTQVMSNPENPNLWHDVYWQYLSFIDPQGAIDLYDSYPDRSLKFGISDAQTYHWLHAMNALGTVSENITADYPIAAAFNNNGEVTYVAHNYSNSPINVSFSDSYVLEVPANQMATSRDVNVMGVLSSDFDQAYANGSVNLTLTTSDSGITKVAFYDGNTLIAEKTSAPYSHKAANLSLGSHGFYAQVYSGNQFNTSNIVTVQVGEQVPYLDSPFEVPGTIEAGYYDKFEGGVGQGISYLDTGIYNEGGFRPEEYVDAVLDSSEGANVGWIAPGEWMEYTIDVTTSGKYNVTLRYACGNSNGGGPFHFELDGTRVSADIPFTSTGDWGAWVNKTVNNVELTAGEHVLRVAVTQGEFNLGKMTFSYASPLDYGPPVANAGENISVLYPETTATLDATASSDPENQTLTYSWKQIYGSSVIDFDDATSVTPEISNLEEGVYKLKLTVSDGTYTAFDFVFVIVSASDNVSPAVTLSEPENNTSYFQGSDINLTATASDLDGTIALVEFYNGVTKIGEDATTPYTLVWSNAPLGTHSLTAKAIDNDGASSVSSSVTVNVTPAASCSGSPDNGHYTYQFSDDANNPTLTFIPTASSTGTPTCILYYGTTEPFPGYPVTPNVPYQINAEEGTTIRFYYTYSYNALESNSYDSQHTYVIGSCSNDAPDNTPPTIEITAPNANSVYNQGGSITIAATATDTDGSITKVEFYDGTSKIGEDTSSPYNITWSSLILGVHTLSAKAIDNDGAITTSNPVPITIQTNSNCPGGIADFDGDSIPDLCDDDIDGDGILNTEDACSNTALGATVDVFGCELFNLPIDNFSIAATSVSCIGNNDGVIGISATDQTFDYSVSINGDGAAASLILNSTNGYSQRVEELTSGTYTICFSVIGVENYEQCSTITIAAPEPLSASSRYNKAEKLVTYNVRGSQSYYIELNGAITKYETSEVHLKLGKGQNRIRIYTDLPCQGFFEEEIFVSEEVLYYPNPTKGPLQLYISGEDTVVDITISNAYGSVLEVIEKEVPNNRVTSIDLTSQPVGIYLIRIEGLGVQQIIKIIKQ